MGEAGDLNKSFIDLDEFNGNWREVYFFLNEVLVKASCHPEIKLMKCYMIFQGPGVISCIVFTFPSLNFKLF